jgi:hypothetical protein
MPAEPVGELFGSPTGPNGTVSEQEPEQAAVSEQANVQEPVREQAVERTAFVTVRVRPDVRMPNVQSAGVIFNRIGSELRTDHPGLPEIRRCPLLEVLEG